MSKMPTLEEHNAAIASMLQSLTEEPAGVACDKCGAEMIATRNEQAPATSVKCVKCGYAGSKLKFQEVRFAEQLP